MNIDPDTGIGGAQNRFPETHQSAIVQARSTDSIVRQRAFDTILTSYWKPVYKYVRLKWQAGNEDAKDLTQGFFANAFEKNHFANYDAHKASFQTFLRTCLDGFVAHERKAGKRLKRGGDREHFQLDFVSAEDEFELHRAAEDLTPEDYFHREWVRGMFTLAVEALRRRCEETSRTVHFRLFERYDLDEQTTSYSSLGREFGLDSTTVNNYLASVRRDFRRIVLEKLREITATEDEFRNEARSLLGVDVK
ncbi:MAG TPA: ECF-type sigma factor [Pyrinomonadaceae bacterium]|nr:ECF-type sigma factor [Pyrinomonadaceae bacterium]